MEPKARERQTIAVHCYLETPNSWGSIWHHFSLIVFPWLGVKGPGLCLCSFPLVSLDCLELQAFILGKSRYDNVDSS